MLLDPTSLKDAARRFEQATQREILPRGGSMSSRIAHLARGLSLDRAKALVYQAEARGARGTQRETLRSLANERIIGTSDLVDMNYLELAVAVARAVARIRLPDGSGTGFLIGDGMLMTNHHVFPDARAAETAVAQFDYQENSAGEMLPTQAYALEPARFFVTDPELDFAIVAVAERSAAGRPIADYPWTQLLGSTGKSERGESVNVIQHPLGGLKQIALRNNEVIEIPQGKPDFLYYTTDTQPGSSGAPCFNDQWELIALHHQGVPRMQGDVILKKDGAPFREGKDSPATIDWIANEGARVSAIVAALRALPLEGERAALRSAFLDGAPPNPVELARRAAAPEIRMPREESLPVAAGGAVSIVVSLVGNTIQGVRIENGAASLPAEVAIPVPASVATPVVVVSDGALAASATASDETTAIDSNWKSRKGYDRDFLGSPIPLPVLSDAQRKLSVEVPPEFRLKASDAYNLHYHHYSLAMNAKRRLAWYSAANIDGDRRFKFPRGKDRWFIDPRIDDRSNPVYQMGEELYAAKETDRGHLTRFLDVAWGARQSEAIAATNDTFHFTNCALQLSEFNQGKDRWQGLEQFLLENKAIKEKRRISVITGPLFKRNDPIYRNPHMRYSIRVPLQFWKVCALIRADGSLSATGFILGQPDIAELPGFEEKFDVTATQVTIARLGALTGLDFGILQTHDHFAKSGKPGALEAHIEGGEEPVKPLYSPEDIVL